MKAPSISSKSTAASNAAAALAPPRVAAGATTTQSKPLERTIEEPEIAVMGDITERVATALPRPMPMAGRCNGGNSGGLGGPAGRRSFPQVMLRSEAAARNLRLGRRVESGETFKDKFGPPSVAQLPQQPPTPPTTEKAGIYSAAGNGTSLAGIGSAAYREKDAAAGLSRDIAAENEARVAAMAPAEIEEAQRELAAMLSPGAIEALRARGRRKLGDAAAASAAPRGETAATADTVATSEPRAEAVAVEAAERAVTTSSIDAGLAPARAGARKATDRTNAGDAPGTPAGEGAAATEMRDAPPSAVTTAATVTAAAPTAAAAAAVAAEPEPLVDLLGVEIGGDSALADLLGGQEQAAGYSVAELVLRCSARAAAERLAALRALEGVLRRRRAAVGAGLPPAHKRLPEMLPVAIRVALEDEDSRVRRSALEGLVAMMAPEDDEAARCQTSLLGHTGHHAPPPLLRPLATAAEEATLAGRTEDAEEGPWPTGSDSSSNRQHISDEEAARDCYTDCAKGMYRLLLLPRLCDMIKSYVSNGSLGASSLSLKTSAKIMESSDAAETAEEVVAAANTAAAVAGAASAMTSCLRILVVMARRSRFLAREVAALPGLLATVEQVCLDPDPDDGISLWLADGGGCSTSDALRGASGVGRSSTVALLNSAAANAGSEAADAAIALAEYLQCAATNRRSLALWGVRLLRVLCQSDRSTAVRVSPLLGGAAGFLAIGGGCSGHDRTGGGAGWCGEEGKADPELAAPVTALEAVQVEVLELWRVCLTYRIDTLGAGAVFMLAQGLTRQPESGAAVTSESPATTAETAMENAAAPASQWGLTPDGTVGLAFVRALHELVLSRRPRVGVISAHGGTGDCEAAPGGIWRPLDWRPLEAMAAAFVERLQRPPASSSDGGDSVVTQAAYLHFVSAVLERVTVHPDAVPTDGNAVVAAAVVGARAALGVLTTPVVIDPAVLAAQLSGAHADWLGGIFRLAYAVAAVPLDTGVAAAVRRAAEAFWATVSSAPSVDRRVVLDAAAARNLCLAHDSASRLLLHSSCVAALSRPNPGCSGSAVVFGPGIVSAASYMLQVVALCGPGDEYVAVQLLTMALKALGSLSGNGAARGGNGAAGSGNDVLLLASGDLDILCRTYGASVCDTEALRHSTALLAGLPAAVAAVVKALPAAKTLLPLPRHWLLLPLAGRLAAPIGGEDEGEAAAVAAATVTGACLKILLRLEDEEGDGSGSGGTGSDGESGGYLSPGFIAPAVKLYYLLLLCLQSATVMSDPRVSAPFEALLRRYIRQCDKLAAAGGATLEEALSAVIEAANPVVDVTAVTNEGAGAASGRNSHKGLVGFVSDLSDAFAADSFGHPGFAAALRLLLRTGFPAVARAFLWRSLGKLGLLGLLTGSSGPGGTSNAAANAGLTPPGALTFTNDPIPSDALAFNKADSNLPDAETTGGGSVVGGSSASASNSTSVGGIGEIGALLWPPDNDPAMLDAYVTALAGPRFSCATEGGELFVAACHHLAIYFFPPEAATGGGGGGNGGSDSGSSSGWKPSWARRARFAALRKAGDEALAAVVEHECTGSCAAGSGSDDEGICSAAEGFVGLVCGGQALPAYAREPLVRALLAPVLTAKR